MTEVSRSTGARIYEAVIKHIFLARYKPGLAKIDFSREDISAAALTLGLKPAKNLGDVVYSYRYRRPLPAEIMSTAPKGKEWTIRATGDATYRFELTQPTRVIPSRALAESRLPDATPGVVAMYALGDEQALLARLRYNRLLDIFTGLACYPLQSHLRTKVKGMGQGEIDEIYVGIDRRGAHYVLPVQAKGGRDQINMIQTEQDMKICAQAFPALTCRPIAAQFMQLDLIALFEFEQSRNIEIAVLAERHYRLVPHEELTAEELATYAKRPE